MSGLSVDEKQAKRERNKRPRHHDVSLSKLWRPWWIPQFHGTYVSTKVRPYRGKSERREVITARRRHKMCGLQPPSVRDRTVDLASQSEGETFSL